MDKFLKAVGIFTVSFVVLAALSALTAYPTMWLVNCLFTASTLAAVFGVAKLTFWHALALDFLCSILFKGGNTSVKA
jgi:uncharacterized membrane protein (DUF485 family)